MVDGDFVLPAFGRTSFATTILVALASLGLCWWLRG